MQKSSTPVRSLNANRVLQVLPLQFYGVEFLDERGAKKQTICFTMGGDVRLPKGHMEWAKELQGGQPWFKEGVLEAIRKAANSHKSVPTSDSVDVV